MQMQTDIEKFQTLVLREWIRMYFSEALCVAIVLPFSSVHT